MKNVNIEALKEQFTETREYGSDVLFAVRSITLDVVMNSTHEPAEDFSVFTLWDMLNDISDLETCARCNVQLYYSCNARNQLKGVTNVQEQHDGKMV